MKKLRTKKIEPIAEEPPPIETANEAPDVGFPPPVTSVRVEMENLATEDDNVEIIGKSQRYSLTMYLDKNTDSKTFAKFIRRVEKLVRSNPDYKMYLDFLRDERGLDKCAYFPNVTSHRAEIQLHHVLSNLYTICVTVANRLMSTGNKVSSFILADEVIKLHLEDKIALVPLSTTVHELVHLNQIRIPKSQIYGHYALYYEQHEPYMDDYERAIYKDNEKFLTVDRKDVQQLEYRPVSKILRDDD